MTTQSDADTAEFADPANRRRGRPGPYSSLVRVDLGGESHPGKVRPNNEDHFLVCRFGRFLEPVLTNLSPRAAPPRSEETGYGMAVADGVGGRAAGEEASRLAITSLVNLVLHTPDWILRPADGSLSDEVLRRAAERYDQVHEVLGLEAEAVPGLRGFGTTLTMAASLGRDLFLAHVGDSRAYLLRRGELRQLTRDHTVAEALAEAGLIDRADVAAHHMRHVLTQALGGHGQRVRADVSRVELEDGDRLLLCSDGLTDMVADVAVGETLGGDGTAQEVCRRLVDRALAAGGDDNVTAVVAVYHLPDEKG